MRAKSLQSHHTGIEIRTGRFRLHTVQSFNRTTQELKLSHRLGDDVHDFSFNRTTQELKYHQNKNHHGKDKPFNRTTQELK